MSRLELLKIARRVEANGLHRSDRHYWYCACGKLKMTTKEFDCMHCGKNNVQIVAIEIRRALDDVFRSYGTLMYRRSRIGTNIL